MATVSVIVSVVLTGCSYGNNVCNSGSVQIKPLADVRRAHERSHGGGVEREACTWMPSPRTLDFSSISVFTARCGYADVVGSEPTAANTLASLYFDKEGEME